MVTHVTFSLWSRGPPAPDDEAFVRATSPPHPWSTPSTEEHRRTGVLHGCDGCCVRRQWAQRPQRDRRRQGRRDDHCTTRSANQAASVKAAAALRDRIASQDSGRVSRLRTDRDEALRAAQEAARRARLAAEQARPRWVLPIVGYHLTAGFGEYGLWSHAHTGQDFAAPIGTPVHALGDGTVIFASYDGAYGNKIVIQHAGGLLTWYAHLSAFEVSRRRQGAGRSAHRPRREHRQHDRPAPAPGDPPAQRHPGGPAALAARARHQVLSEAHRVPERSASGRTERSASSSSQSFSTGA